MGYDDLVLEFNMILQALQREAGLKWQTVTLFQQKPPLEQTEGETAGAEADAPGGSEENKQLDSQMEGVETNDGGATQGNRGR